MKPGLTKVFLSVAPGITSPQTLYLIIDGADFAVLLSGLAQVCLAPDMSCIACVRTKKGSRQTPAFTLLRKHLQDLRSSEYQVSPFLLYLTFF